MATTSFFEKEIQCLVDPKNKMTIEFGRSSYTGKSLVYLEINDYSIMLDEKTGREMCEAMDNLAAYLGYDRPVRRPGFQTQVGEPKRK